MMPAQLRLRTGITLSHHALPICRLCSGQGVGGAVVRLETSSASLEEGDSTYPAVVLPGVLEWCGPTAWPDHLTLSS